MTMTSCRECQHGISTTARACPQCGAVVPRPARWPWIVGVPLVLVAALLVLGATHEPRKPDYLLQAEFQRDHCMKTAEPGEAGRCDDEFRKTLVRAQLAGSH